MSSVTATSVDREALRERERQARAQLAGVRGHDSVGLPIFPVPVKVDPGQEDETTRRIKSTLGDFNQFHAVLSHDSKNLIGISHPGPGGAAAAAAREAASRSSAAGSSGFRASSSSNSGGRSSPSQDSRRAHRSHPKRSSSHLNAGSQAKSPSSHGSNKASSSSRQPGHQRHGTGGNKPFDESKHSSGPRLVRTENSSAGSTNDRTQQQPLNGMIKPSSRPSSKEVLNGGSALSGSFVKSSHRESAGPKEGLSEKKRTLPKLRLSASPEASKGGSDGQADLETILKEMKFPPPLTAIETPRKEEKITFSPLPDSVPVPLDDQNEAEDLLERSSKKDASPMGSLQDDLRMSSSDDERPVSPFKKASNNLKNRSPNNDSLHPPPPPMEKSPSDSSSASSDDSSSSGSDSDSESESSGNERGTGRWSLATLYAKTKGDTGCLGLSNQSNSDRMEATAFTPCQSQSNNPDFNDYFLKSPTSCELFPPVNKLSPVHSSPRSHRSSPPGSPINSFEQSSANQNWPASGEADDRSSGPCQLQKNGRITMRLSKAKLEQAPSVPWTEVSSSTLQEPAVTSVPSLVPSSVNHLSPERLQPVQTTPKTQSSVSIKSSSNSTPKKRTSSTASSGSAEVKDTISSPDPQKRVKPSLAPRSLGCVSRTEKAEVRQERADKRISNKPVPSDSESSGDEENERLSSTSEKFLSTNVSPGEKSASRLQSSSIRDHKRSSHKARLKSSKPRSTSGSSKSRSLSSKSEVVEVISPLSRTPQSKAVERLAPEPLNLDSCVKLEHPQLLSPIPSHPMSADSELKENSAPNVIVSIELSRLSRVPPYPPVKKEPNEAGDDKGPPNLEVQLDYLSSPARLPPRDHLKEIKTEPNRTVSPSDNLHRHTKNEALRQVFSSCATPPINKLSKRKNEDEKRHELKKQKVVNMSHSKSSKSKDVKNDNEDDQRWSDRYSSLEFCDSPNSLCSFTSQASRKSTSQTSRHRSKSSSKERSVERAAKKESDLSASAAHSSEKLSSKKHDKEEKKHHKEKKESFKSIKAEKESRKRESLHDGDNSSQANSWDGIFSDQSEVNGHETPGSKFVSTHGKLKEDCDWSRNNAHNNHVSSFQWELENRQGSSDFYLTEAKKLKHQADRETDLTAQAMKYLDAVLYFILTGNSMEYNHASVDNVYIMYKETLNLIKHISSKFRKLQNSSYGNLDTKLAVLSLRCQSLLYQKLYKLRRNEIRENLPTLDDFLKTNVGKLASSAPSAYHQNALPAPSRLSQPSPCQPSPHSPTPSPAGSVASVGSQSSGYSSCEVSSRGVPSAPIPHGGTPQPPTPTMPPTPSPVMIPQQMYLTLQKQTLHLTNLHKCHDLWEQADSLINRSHLKEFFSELDNHCGRLTLHSSSSDLVQYVRDGLYRLKDRT